MFAIFENVINPDLEANEITCFGYGKSIYDDGLPVLPTIARNALVFIPLFSLWRFIFERLIHAEAQQFAQRQPDTKPATFAMNVLKYKESYWKTITNSFLMFYGFYALWVHSPQFSDPSLLYSHKWPQTMGTSELTYYRLAIGYHGHRAIYGLFYEKKRSDYIAYVIHHWATVVLIVISWMCGLTQTGCIVLSLHDPSDVLLAGAKLCSYWAWPTGVAVMYALFFISWVLCRWTLFPLKVIAPLIRELPGRLHCHPKLGLFFLTLLCVLYALHLFWGRAIIQHMYRLFKKKPEDCMVDPRSDDEADTPYTPRAAAADKKRK